MKLSWLGFAVLGGVLSSMYINCGGLKTAQIGAPPEVREAVLSKALFSGDVAVAPDVPSLVRIPVAVSEDGVTGTRVGGGLANLTEPAGSVTGQRSSPKTHFPVKLVCSIMGSKRIGGNLLTEDAVWLEIRNSQNDVLCRITDPEVKNEIMDSKQIPISSLSAYCPMVSAGNYFLALRSERIPNLLTTKYDPETFDMSGRVPITVQVDSNGALFVAKADERPIYVAFGGGTNENPRPLPSVIGAGVSRNVYDKECAIADYHASPLVVQFIDEGYGPRSFDLTSQSKGILFDILGANADPAPHTKKQISWFKVNSGKNYFVTLPKQGRIDGVDELFGDNTRGPDGGFAANGYEALRKWDGRRADGSFDAQERNGLIDSGDWIFQYLRLWGDPNANGSVEKGELLSLSQMNVEAIDLNYDPNYHETDKYGNRILMKSLVKTRDGRFHLIYDIWFRLTK